MRTGAYAITVPTTWFYSSKLRTRVVRTRAFRGDVSRAHRMSVVPAHTPLGSAHSWAELSRYGDRFNPCRTVTYGINTRGPRPTPPPSRRASTTRSPWCRRRPVCSTTSPTPRP